MTDYLIWWTNQNDCERITPLETWPMYLYTEWRARQGRAGRGRLWVPGDCEGCPEEAKWDDSKWTCQAAHDAGGIVIKAKDVGAVMFLPGFVTTFDMSLPDCTQWVEREHDGIRDVSNFICDRCTGI